MHIITSHYQFQLSEPFQEGQPLSAIDAQHLNSIRAQRLQKLVLKWVQEEEAECYDPVLSFEKLRQLQCVLDNVDQHYRLPPLPPRGPSILQQEIELTARLRLDPLDPQWQEKMVQLCADPALREEARQNLIAKLTSIPTLEDILP